MKPDARPRLNPKTEVVLASGHLVSVPVSVIWEHLRNVETGPKPHQEVYSHVHLGRGHVPHPGDHAATQGCDAGEARRPRTGGRSLRARGRRAGGETCYTGRAVEWS